MTLLQKIRIAASAPDKIPKGFLTAEDWGKAWGMKKNATLKYIKAGVEAGLMTRIDLRATTARCVREVPFYGPTKK